MSGSLPVPGGSRTTLRWRLTLVYGAVALGVGLLLLLLSVLLVDRANRVSSLPGLGNQFLTLDGRVVTVNGQPLTAAMVQERLRQDAVHQLFQQGLLALVVLGGLGVALSYFLSGRILRPLQQITSTARRLSAEQLDERIGLAGPADELKELADVIDDMLARLQASFEGQRRFVADASHELRTPLAVMRTEVDVALADPDASVDELRAAAEVVRDATERAERLVDSLLLLARSDALSVAGLPVTERVELSAVAAAALRAVREEVDEANLHVLTSWDDACVLGDPRLLERLAGNLVENAVRHNLPGGAVEVESGTHVGRAYLSVANDGELLADADVEPLFEPFRRHGRARTAHRGAGLGLAIVRAVAGVHGGNVRATARPQGGLQVVVDLPLATSSSPD